ASWYPDPTGRYQQRYWDGAQWTEHVATDGQTGTDPLPPAAPRAAADDQVPVGYDDPNRVAQQVSRATGGKYAGGGGGSVFTEPVLVVNQKAKLIELTNQYAVYDQTGRQIAGVQEVG